MEVGELVAGASTEQVRRAGEVRALPPAGVDPALVTGLHVGTPGWGDSSVGEILERHQSHGLVVLHRGRLALDWLAPGAAASDRHRCYSVTKSFTGTLAAMAVADGRLDRSARVGDLVVELGDSGFADATVGQVADMTVSVGYDEDYGEAGDGPSVDGALGFGDYLIALGLDLGGEDGSAAGSIRAFLRAVGTGPTHHGDAFTYATPVTDVLAWLLEQASGGQPYRDALGETIWSRIGAEWDASLSFDPAGTPVCGGGLAVTTRDLARFGLVLAEGGRRGEDQIIPRAVIESIRDGGDLGVFQQGGTYGYLAGYSYRDQWWMPGGPHRPLSAWGIHGQLLWVDPAAELVVACHSGGPEPDSQRRDQEHDAMCRALAEACQDWD